MTSEDATRAADGRSPVGLDLGALDAYFAANVPGVAGPLTGELIAGGRSNLTYRVTDGSTTWVVRRPPLGHLTPTAHDMGREVRVMSALGPAGVPVPATVAYCDDTAVIGAPFSVVAFVPGTIVRGEKDAAALDPAAAHAAANALVDTLAKLHAVDYVAAGLGGFGRPEGFLERQVRRWYGQWGRVQTRALPDLERLHERLASRVPTESAASVVHGDYRLDNVLLAPGDTGRIAAILDWEMAALGDPLADLGLLCVYWDPACGAILPDGHAPSANPGFPTVDALIDLYARASHRDVSNLGFYRALGYFKLAIIAEGIHGRFLAGLTVGEGFETVGHAVPALAARGLTFLAARETTA